MRRTVRLALGALVAAPIFVGLASSASAHAAMESTNPTADSTVTSVPDSVRLDFSEPVTAVPGGVRVLDPDGNRTDTGSVRSLADGRSVMLGVRGVAHGTYTVSWRVTSDDGHTISASWVFHVVKRTGAVDTTDQASSAVAAASWVGRFSFYGGLVALLGLMLFRELVLDDVAAFVRSGRLAGGVLIAGAALVMIGRSAETVGGSVWDGIVGLPDLIGTTRATSLDGVRLLLSFGLASTAWLSSTPARRALVGVIGFGLAIVVAVSGHAWVATPTALTVGADAAHVLAASMWVGGVGALLVAARAGLVQASRASRFSTLAGAALAVVAITGMISAWVQLDEVSALWSTRYGRLLLAKLALVTAMGVLGLMNRRTISALVGRSFRPTRSLRFEALAGIGVLAVTATLVATVPGRESISQPVTTSVAIGQGAVIVDVTPARRGINQVHLNFADANGIATPVDAAELAISTGTIEPRKIPLLPLTPSHLTAPDVSFGAPGKWTLTITAVRAGTASTATVPVIIR